MSTPSPSHSTTEQSLGRRLRRLGAGLWSLPGRAWTALVVACVGSRLATTITYIEDPDSLRFALSVAEEFDVADLQPHFPGYPVFWAATEFFYLPGGSFSTSFSIVGGLATAGLIWALLRLRGAALHSVDGATIAGGVFFCPLLWLMGNRYMPDLLGTAGALTTLVVLLRALPVPPRALNERAALIGITLAGLLAGLRLSYLPLVLVPVLAVLWRSHRPGWLVGAGTAGVAVWLVPMVLDTGFWTLIDVAWGQTTGHFTDFGGTVETESNLGRRFTGLLQGVWADGLGGWWPGRHPVTGLTSAALLGLGGLGGWHLSRRAEPKTPRFWILGACVLLYGLWIFFFQNVIHKSRHVLPLLALLLPICAEGAAALWRTKSALFRGLVLLSVGAYAAITLVLVDQHRTPSAVAQAKDFVESTTQTTGPTRVASVPLINTYLRTQQVDAQFLSVEDTSDVRRLREAETGRTLVVGTYASLLDRPPTRTRTFYHNPYVNRMWPTVNVYVYEH
ncbi:MAG: hypothetical protein R6T83_01785 [Salinibacter sp.]